MGMIVCAVADTDAGTMAGSHPVHIHPVRPLYRFAATGLGASMWFFVSMMPVVALGIY